MQASSKRSSRPTTLTVANYRCFAEPTKIRLAPLTLLYGWNNSGKSALVRMLALIGNSVRDEAAAPLDVGFFGDGASLGALVRSGDGDIGKESGVSFQLDWDDGEDPSRVQMVVDYFNERRFSYLRSIVLTNGQSGRTMHWEADEKDEERRSFVRLDGDDAPVVQLPFVGLIPPENVPELEGLRARMLALRNRIQWLRAVRVLPEFLKATGQRPRRLDNEGKDAVQMISTDAALYARVQAFYEIACQRRLEVREVKDKELRVTLTPLDMSVNDIPLKDTGEGMAQCLPVLVAIAMAERPDGPQIVAIEEPDAHLHPKVQTALVDFLCETVNAPHKPALVLETHSNALILSVQLAIAKGRIAKEDVCVYWLEQDYDGVTRPKEVTFTDEGIPTSNHVRGIFAQEAEIIKELSEHSLDG